MRIRAEDVWFQDGPDLGDAAVVGSGRKRR
jgi:hypothetical protein